MDLQTNSSPDQVQADLDNLQKLSATDQTAFWARIKDLISASKAGSVNTGLLKRASPLAITAEDDSPGAGALIPVATAQGYINAFAAIVNDPTAKVSYFVDADLMQQVLNATATDASGNVLPVTQVQFAMGYDNGLTLVIVGTNGVTHIACAGGMVLENIHPDIAVPVDNFPSTALLS